MKLMLILLFEATVGRAERHEFSRPLMGMAFRIIIHSEDERLAKRAAQLAFDRVAALDKIMSDYSPASELNKLSNLAGSGKEARISDQLCSVLTRAQSLANETGGAFDVTAGASIQLWRRARRVKRLPPQFALDKALKTIGFQNLKLDSTKCTAELIEAGTLLDLGGIAKGYFGDVAVARMREAGATRCIADVGLDLVTWRTEGQPEFTIGVRNPWGEGLMGVLTAGDGAVVTSGDYERFVTIDGKPYSHIVDPRTGQPVQGMRSVTVLTAVGAEADALATALFVMGYEAGAAHVEGRDDVEAILVGDHDGSPDRQQVFISAGLVERFQWSEDVLSR